MQEAPQEALLVQQLFVVLVLVEQLFVFIELWQVSLLPLILGESILFHGKFICIVFVGRHNRSSPVQASERLLSVRCTFIKEDNTPAVCRSNVMGNGLPTANGDLDLSGLANFGLGGLNGTGDQPPNDMSGNELQALLSMFGVGQPTTNSTAGDIPGASRNTNDQLRTMLEMLNVQGDRSDQSNQSDVPASTSGNSGLGIEDLLRSFGGLGSNSTATEASGPQAGSNPPNLFSSLLTGVKSIFANALNSVPPVLRKFRFRASDRRCPMNMPSALQGFRIAGVFTADKTLPRVDLRVAGTDVIVPIENGVGCTSVVSTQGTAAAVDFRSASIEIFPQANASNVQEQTVDEQGVGASEQPSDAAFDCIVFIELYFTDMSEMCAGPFANNDPTVLTKRKTVEAEGIATTIIPRVGNVCLDTVEMESIQFEQSTITNEDDCDDTAGNGEEEETVASGGETLENNDKSVENVPELSSPFQSGAQTASLVLLDFSTGVSSESDTLPLMYYLTDNICERPVAYSLVLLIDENGQCLTDLVSYRPRMTFLKSDFQRIAVVKCKTFVPQWKAGAPSNEENNSAPNPAAVNDGDFLETVRQFTIVLTFKGSRKTNSRVPRPAPVAASATSETATAAPVSEHFPEESSVSPSLTETPIEPVD